MSQLLLTFANPLTPLTCLHIYYALFQISPRAVPLEIAACKGHVLTVQGLLDGGANINYQDEVSSMFSSCAVIDLYCYQ